MKAKRLRSLSFIPVALLLTIGAAAPAAEGPAHPTHTFKLDKLMDPPTGRIAGVLRGTRVGNYFARGSAVRELKEISGLLEIAKASRPTREVAADGARWPLKGTNLPFTPEELEDAHYKNPRWPYITVVNMAADKLSGLTRRQAKLAPALAAEVATRLVALQDGMPTLWRTRSAEGRRFIPSLKTIKRMAAESVEPIRAKSTR